MLITISVTILLLLGIVMKEVVLTDNTTHRKTVYMIVKSIDDSFEFWQIVRMGAEAAAKEFNSELIFTGPKEETEIQEQIDIVKKALQKRPEAIVLAATDFEALVPVAEKVVKENIHLITVDSAIRSKVAESFVATDNISASTAAGEKMAQLIGGKGKVAIVSHIQGTSTAINRAKGFTDAVSGYDGIEMVGTAYSKGDPDEACRLTKEMIQKVPDLAGIFGANQQSAEGVARALKDLELAGKIKLVAFDSSVEQIQYIEQGVIQAVVVQRPFNMGYLSVKAALMAARGQKVEKRIDTGFEVITKENMYTPENQKLLFPFVER